MNFETALQLIREKKRLADPIVFVRRINHVGHVIGVSQLTDENGVYFPGLTLEIEVKAPIVTNECLFQFSLRQRLPKKRVIVYQLDVIHRTKKSHNGLIPIYGPHEHVGDDEPAPVEESSASCQDWNGCLAWFAKRVNVNGLDVERPC